MEEKILVSLGDGQSLQELAQGLLDVADDPHDVETSPRQGGFLVPQSLAARYAEVVASAAAEQPKAKASTARTRRARASDAAANTETTAKTPRAQRGRARATAAKASTSAKKGQAKGAAKGDDAGVNDA